MGIDYSVLALPKGTPATCCVCGGPPQSVTGVLGPGGTCSRICGQRRRRSSREAPPTRRAKSCEACQRPFTAKWLYDSRRFQRFCSDTCRRVVLARRPAMLTVQCSQCGAHVKRTAGAVKRVTRVFCSKECRAKGLSGENHGMFRGDKDPNRGAAWNRRADTIRERDGYKCRRCDKTQGENGQKLSVDHVRPWRTFEDKELANHPDNLVALCRVCHSFKTTTVERAWLRGDVIAWKRWVASLHLPSAKFGWVA